LKKNKLQWPKGEGKLKRPKTWGFLNNWGGTKLKQERTTLPNEGARPGERGGKGRYIATEERT